MMGAPDSYTIDSAAPTCAPRTTYSHDRPVRHGKHGYISTVDQSDAVTPRSKYHTPVKHGKHGYISTVDQSDAVTPRSKYHTPVRHGKHGNTAL
eukprot:1195522-Prorocentrum_minimum.AAC.8